MNYTKTLITLIIFSTNPLAFIQCFVFHQDILDYINYQRKGPASPGRLSLTREQFLCKLHLFRLKSFQGHVSIISNLKNLPWLSYFFSKQPKNFKCQKTPQRILYKMKKRIFQIASKMKSREHIHLDIYRISRGYVTFPQKPQKIFKFCLH